MPFSGPTKVSAGRSTATATAYEQWRNNVFDPPVSWDIAGVVGYRDGRRIRRHRQRRLEGEGQRCGLPSMLGRDERRMRMVYSLAFSLPASPVLYYGEEIGMAENLDARSPTACTALSG
jgi:glycosidase